ncbi:MAG: hypothetical protein EOO82_00340 [Oxalobacteraceae bacterium]|nr:MAG: hypothetical protein EOO82_00340 [Oxalobacteraceae bacterium]
MTQIEFPVGLPQERLKFSQRTLVAPLALFAGVLVAYALTSFAILASASVPLLVILLVPVSGVLVVMLFVIAHDACHQSFTSSRTLNNWIGRIGMLPSLHALSLWESEHNRRHHRFNNIRGMDYAWIPLSPQEFMDASAFTRLRYQFYRSPVGVPFYYLFDIWAQRKIFPRSKMVGRASRTHIWDALLLWVFTVGYSVLLIYVGDLFGRSAAASVVYALILPFLIFIGAISFAIFLHHTHYQVPWYGTLEQWKRGNGALHGTVHVKFPLIVRRVTLQIMEHNAHHVAPGVPLYNLEEMQRSPTIGKVVEWPFSLKGYFRICARCKLYDFEQNIWTDFGGKATSGRLLDNDDRHTLGTG